MDSRSVSVSVVVFVAVSNTVNTINFQNSSSFSLPPFSNWDPGKLPTVNPLIHLITVHKIKSGWYCLPESPLQKIHVYTTALLRFKIKKIAIRESTEK